MVQLDDLRAREHARRLRREAHHQHRTEREVRHQHRRHAGLVAQVRQDHEVLVGPAGGADHDRDAAVERGARDVDRDGIDRAVDDGVEPVRDERAEVVVGRHAADALAAAPREGRRQRQIVRRFDGLASDAPKSPERAGNPDAQHVHYVILS